MTDQPTIDDRALWLVTREWHMDPADPDQHAMIVGSALYARARLAFALADVRREIRRSLPWPFGARRRP